MSNTVFRNLLVGAGLAVVAFGSTVAVSETTQIKSDIDAATIVPAKATPLQLYLTPDEAHRALTADPGIIFIDVRDPLEVMFVGHPEGVDKIIPLGIATHEVDPNTGQYRLVANDDFVADVDALVAKQGKTKMDPIIVSCRSGARSAIAARKLIAAGYTNVWSLVEGFEGDKAADGTRTKNGWRNAGLPWSYKLAPGVAWQDCEGPDTRTC